jgi:hypothetical protein
LTRSIGQVTCTRPLNGKARQLRRRFSHRLVRRGPLPGDNGQAMTRWKYGGGYSLAAPAANLRRWSDAMPKAHQSNVESGVPACCVMAYRSEKLAAVYWQVFDYLVPAVGIEPTTNGLQNRCSTN